MKKSTLSFFRTACAILLSAPSCFAILPDNITVNVGDIDGDSQDEILVLTKRSIRSATHYQVKTWDSVNGYQDHPVSEVRTYRGYVQDDPDMLVNANIEGTNMLNANLSDGRQIRHALQDVPVIVNSAPRTPTTADPGNGNVIIPRVVSRVSPTPNGYIIPKYTMRRMELAAEVKNTYYVGMGSDVDAAVARVEQRVNDTEFFYARDLGMAWELTTIVIRLEPLTTDWKDEWKNTLLPGGAKYNVASQFKEESGGVATGTIYTKNNPEHHAYISVGTLTSKAQTLGHEVGHLYKGRHSVSWTDIMDGAESCIGAGNIERMINASNLGVESTAPAMTYGSPLPPYAMEDSANTQQNTPVEIDLLENDYDGNGDTITLESADTASARGGSITILTGGKVRYTPAAGFLGQDEFSYAVSDSNGLTNRTGYVKIYVRNQGLATRIKFDETTGTAIADSGPYQAHGTLIHKLSTADSVAGKVGTAIKRLPQTVRRDLSAAEFLGVGDPLTGSLSVSLWVKFDNVPTANGVLACKGSVIENIDNPYGGWAISHVAGSGFRFAGNTQRDLARDADGNNIAEKFDRTSTTPIVANQWYHLVMLIDRPNLQIRAWVNNQEVTNSEWTSVIPNATIQSAKTPLVIYNSRDKRHKLELTSPVTIDDFRIYNNVLTPAEINVLYQVGDTDADGIPDYWELDQFGDISTASDTSNFDGDPMNDLQEFISGTNPKNTEDYFAVNSINEKNNGRELTWKSVAGKIYTIQYIEKLGQGAWQSIASGISGAAGTTIWLDTDTTRRALPTGFYRVRVDIAP